jgi:hypothetical protein
VLPVEGFPIIRHWFIVHRRDKRMSAASQAFRELLLSQMPAAAAVHRQPSQKDLARGSAQSQPPLQRKRSATRNVEFGKG